MREFFPLRGHLEQLCSLTFARFARDTQVPHSKVLQTIPVCAAHPHNKLNNTHKPNVSIYLEHRTRFLYLYLFSLTISQRIESVGTVQNDASVVLQV